MRHYRFVIDEMSVSGEVLKDVGGSLIVADLDGGDGIDWELVCRSSRAKIEMASHLLEMNGPEGELSGPALLVRSNGVEHVFRGAGALLGFAGFPF